MTTAFNVRVNGEGVYSWRMKNRECPLCQTSEVSLEASQIVKTSKKTSEVSRGNIEMKKQLISS